MWNRKSYLLGVYIPWGNTQTYIDNKMLTVMSSPSAAMLHANPGESPYPFPHSSNPGAMSLAAAWQPNKKHWIDETAWMTQQLKDENNATTTQHANNTTTTQHIQQINNTTTIQHIENTTTTQDNSSTA